MPAARKPSPPILFAMRPSIPLSRVAMENLRRARRGLERSGRRPVKGGK